MKTKFLTTSFLVIAITLFSGCGDSKQPSLADAVKSSFKISNGMKIEEVEKLMQVAPTAQEKLGDIVIYRYEGETRTGEKENLKIAYNNVMVKFQDGKVINSGTFSCEVPQINKD